MANGQIQEFTSHGIFLCSRTSLVRCAHGQNLMLYRRSLPGVVGGRLEPGGKKISQKLESIAPYRIQINMVKFLGKYCEQILFGNKKFSLTFHYFTWICLYSCFHVMVSRIETWTFGNPGILNLFSNKEYFNESNQHYIRQAFYDL